MLSVLNEVKEHQMWFRSWMELRVKKCWSCLACVFVLVWYVVKGVLVLLRKWKEDVKCS